MSISSPSPSPQLQRGQADKGEDKGALIHVERAISNADTGEPLVTIIHTSFCRADGGFGESFGPQFTPHELPRRAPDEVIEAPTRPDAALLYRLNVDRNPLHADPDVAARAGFPRPILHGLCTYGTTCRAIITNVLGHDASKIVGYDVRFSSPVFPGETVLVDVWKDGNVVSFRARLKEREIVAINNGKCTLSG